MSTTITKENLTEEDRAVVITIMNRWGVMGRYENYIDELALLYQAWKMNQATLTLLKQYLIESDTAAYASLRLIQGSTDMEVTLNGIVDKVIRERCMELDKLGSFLFYYLLTDSRTHRLTVTTVSWNLHDEGERYCFVKSGNFFLTKEAARQAIDRAVNH